MPFFLWVEDYFYLDISYKVVTLIWVMDGCGMLWYVMDCYGKIQQDPWNTI